MFPARKSIVLRRISPPSLNGNQQMNMALKLLCAPRRNRREQRNATASGTRFIRLLLTFGALIAPCLGAINVAVVGTTNTQATITWDHAGSCTVQVSEKSDLSVPAIDVNPTLFTNANQDTRAGSLTVGTSHVFVIGKRLTEQGLDSNWYSRALQTNTVHYGSVTCGADSGTFTFSTQNVPLGNTNVELPQVDAAGLGVIPTFPNDRSTTVIDPATGVLVKRLYNNPDGASLSLGSQARGNPCSSVLSGPGPGYFCLFSPFNGGTLAYYIIPSTGEIRYLGVAKIDGDTYYPNGGGSVNVSSGVNTGTAATRYISTNSRDGTEILVLKVAYNGDYTTVAPGAITPFTVMMLTPHGDDLLARLHTFDSAFNPVSYSGFGSPGQVGGCGLVGSNGDYNIVECKRGQQDTYGRYFVMRMSDGAITGEFPFTFSSLKRWCGIHTSYQIPGTTIGFLAAHGTSGGNATPNTPAAIGAGPYVTFLASGISSTDTTITVTGEPLNAHDSVYEPFLMNAAVGDAFQLQNIASGLYEEILITAKAGNVWTVTRAATGIGSGGQPAMAWPSGAQLQADCKEWRDIWWDFSVNPNPDAAGPGMTIEGFDSSHNDIEPWGKVTGFATGKFSSPANYINQAPMFSYVDPTFAGAWSTAPGNAASDYTSMQVPSQNVVLNERNFYGIDGYGGSTLISGETQVYDYGDYGTLGPSSIDSKRKGTLVMSSGHQLVDISGPGSHLISGNVWHYCYAYEAGECRTSGDPGGAGVAGHTYAVVPNLSSPLCNISTGPTSSASNLCVLNTMPQGGLIQLGTSANGVGLPPGYTSPTYLGFGYGRMLTSGFSGIRDTGGLAKPLVDGSWTFVNDGMSRSMEHYTPSSGSWSSGQVTLTLGTHNLKPQQRITVSGINPVGYNGQFQISTITSTTISWSSGDPGTYISGGLVDVPLGLLAVKMPPMPTSAPTDRSTFVRQALSITSPGGTVTTAAVQFGYAEYGTPSQHYCTSRRETCVAVAAAVTDATPFQFETTDTYSRMDCASSCTITIPVLPVHVAYYQVKFYDSGGSFVSDGPAGVVGDFVGYGSTPGNVAPSVPMGIGALPINTLDWAAATPSGCNATSPSGFGTTPGLCVGGGGGGSAGGDTMYATAWAADATGMPVPSGLPLYTTMNDLKVPPCGGNIAIAQLSVFDWATPNASRMDAVNCFTSMNGQDSPVGWKGKATSGDLSGTTAAVWHSKAAFFRGGRLYLTISRQLSSGVGIVHDSTMLRSDDKGVTWSNPYTVSISGTPQANGDGPLCGAPNGTSACTDAHYSTSIMWPALPPAVQGFQAVEYMQDGATPPTGINDGCDPAIWTCFMADPIEGTVARVLNTLLPRLLASDYQYYTCPTITDKKTCDGSLSGSWSYNFADRTPAGVPRGIMQWQSITHHPEFHGYLAVGAYAGVGFGWSPAIYGPWTYIKNTRTPTSGSGVEFTSVPLALKKVVSANPPHVTITVASDTKAYNGGGTPYFSQWDMVLGRTPAGRGEVPMLMSMGMPDNQSISPLHSGVVMSDSHAPRTIPRSGLQWLFDFYDYGRIPALPPDAQGMLNPAYHEIANGSAVLMPCRGGGTACDWNTGQGTISGAGYATVSQLGYTADIRSMRHETADTIGAAGVYPYNLSFINAPTAMQGNGTYTVAGVFRYDGSGDGSLWSTGGWHTGDTGGVSLQYGSGGTGLAFAWGGNKLTSSFNLTAGNWYFIAVTVTANGTNPTGSMWVGNAGMMQDKMVGSTRTGSIAPSVGAAPMVLGDGANASFAWLSVHSRALGQAEVGMMYQTLKAKMAERGVTLQ
jgi:hypothetical protein